ncbi:MAG TPA: hypothetical protein VMT54_20320, partial [Candidatus Cybelea sp.]|nr:hypothetical protein [Candidatus Cybelea sp.]
MERYVGLDVSMEETSMCVLDSTGSVVWEGKAETAPLALLRTLHLGTGGGEGRAGVWSALDLAVARVAFGRHFGDMHRCSARKGGVVDAVEQDRPQRCAGIGAV